MSTFFINGKQTLINGAKYYLTNPRSWIIIISVAPFKIIFLFSKDLIAFIISFISLFVSVIPEPVIFESLLLIFLQRT